MSLTIELPPADEALLRVRAEKAGVPAADLATVFIRESLAVEPRFPEIMAAVAADFVASGMTEDELDAFVHEVREEIWQEKQQGRPT